MKLEEIDVAAVVFSAHATMHRVQAHAHGVRLLEIEMPSGASVLGIETTVGGKRTIWVGDTGIELRGAATPIASRGNDDLGRPPPPHGGLPIPVQAAPVQAPAIDSVPATQPGPSRDDGSPEDDRETSLPRPQYRPPDPPARRERRIVR